MAGTCVAVGRWASHNTQLIGGSTCFPDEQNKDGAFTQLHMHRAQDADRFDDFSSDKLPLDDVFVPPQHQPLNPEDEDDVVPDQHAAFGIARALQRRDPRFADHPPWRDLGLEQLMRRGPPTGLADAGVDRDDADGVLMLRMGLGVPGVGLGGSGGANGAANAEAETTVAGGMRGGGSGDVVAAPDAGQYSSRGVVSEAGAAGTGSRAVSGAATTESSGAAAPRRARAAVPATGRRAGMPR